MGFGAVEATGLGFVCFVVVNPRVLSANRIDFGLFMFIFFKFTSPTHTSDVIGQNHESALVNKQCHEPVGGGGIYEVLL